MFNIPFFSGQEITVIRYGPGGEVKGQIVAPTPRWLVIPGQIQPSSDLRNIQRKFGEDVQAAIYLSTPKNYPLTIQTDSKQADIVLYRGQLWKVEESILYDQLIPHNEATAALLDHPPEELTAFLPGRLVTQSGDGLTTEAGEVYALE